MPHWIGRALREFTRHAELYGVLASVPFLIVLSALGITDSHWIAAATLMTLLLLAISVRRDRAADAELRRTLETLVSTTGGEAGVRWYSQRSEATSDMQEDLARYGSVSFLGVSHERLAVYLGRVKGKALPWERVQICFAPESLGEHHDPDFVRKARTARQDIAIFFTTADHVSRMPHLKSVKLIQHQGIVAHSGSLFGHDDRRRLTIYVVHSAVSLRGRLHEGLTMRLESARKGTPIHEQRMGYYEGIYKELVKTARVLGEVSPTIWDDSADEWDQYASHSPLVKECRKWFFDVAQLGSDDEVLDLGAGAGYPAGGLSGGAHVRSVVLLDSSPQMIRLARNRFRGPGPRVDVALCQLPDVEQVRFSLGDQDFSVITIFQALHELLHAFGDAKKLAEWCRGRLRPGGRVVIAAHNGVVETEAPGIKWVGWNDPLRESLHRLLDADAQCKPHLRPRTVLQRIEQQEIKDAFADRGFKLDGEMVKVLDLDFEERGQMWRVPAVADSIVDVRVAGKSRVREIVEEAVRQQSGETMPRTMVYWRFRLQ